MLVIGMRALRDCLPCFQQLFTLVIGTRALRIGQAAMPEMDEMWLAILVSASKLSSEAGP